MEYEKADNKVQRMKMLHEFISEDDEELLKVAADATESHIMKKISNHLDLEKSGIRIEKILGRGAGGFTFSGKFKCTWIVTFLLFRSVMV